MRKFPAQVLSSVVSVLSVSLSLNTAYAAGGPVPEPVPKPLQLVALAFDGSEMANRWEETRALARQYPVKFTYFMSGVMWLGRTEASRGNDPGTQPYWGPQHKPGASDIGFSTYQAGNTLTNQPLITQRINEANAALAEGNELGSHLNGHFESHGWQPADWQQEFADFWNLLYTPVYMGSKGQGPRLDRTSFLRNMKYTRRTTKGPTYDPVADKDAIVGFRAPLLAWTPGMYPVLQANGFLYDTSKVAQQNYWPEKINGQYWNFPLGQVNLQGCVGGPHGRTVFNIANFTPDASGKYPDQNIYVNRGVSDPLQPGEIAYQEQCDTLTMDYNLLVAQSDPAHRVAPIMIMGKTEDERRQLKLFENQIVDTYRAYFKSNYNGNRAPVNIGHHFALWNSGIYWNAMQRVAKEVCVLSDVRCIKYKDLMQYMEHLTPVELAAYRAGRFTKETELDLHLASNDSFPKQDREISSEDNKAYQECMAHFRDSFCNKMLSYDQRIRQQAQHAMARVQHLRLTPLEQEIRVDLSRFNAEQEQRYAWLLKPDLERHPLLTKMINYTEAEMRRLMPESRALECEGGDQACVDQINDKVSADGGQPYQGK